MALNLLNDKSFNDYLTDITYAGESVPKQQNYRGEFESPDYVYQHRDEIIKGILNQYIKLRVREYILNMEHEPAFIPVDKNRADLPSWTGTVFNRGDKIYEFDGTKMSDKLRGDVITVRDYLYDVAGMYVDKVIETARRTKRKPRIRYDYLKTSNEFATFDMALDAAHQWHEHMAEELARRNKGKELLNKSLVGVQHIMDLPGNMAAYQLMTPDALDFESDYMGHCVGRGSYDADVASGKTKIYSIRDEHGEPHVTLEVRGTGVHQIKGKQNKAPVRKYVPAVVKFIESQHLEIVNDLKNLGLIRQDGKFYDIYNLPKNFVVKGDLDLSDMELTELPDLSTVTVLGNFNCEHNQLTSLVGAPKSVGGDFVCKFNQLTSLTGAPKSVGGDFYCHCNQLTSLTGAPKSVGGDFWCEHKQLTSLEHAPKSVGGSFLCNHNQLTSLVGAPESVGRSFDCKFNQLTSLVGAPKSVGGDFVCNFNQLTSLVGTPKSVGGGFWCDSNQLTSLTGAPKSISGGFFCSSNQLTSLVGAPESVGMDFYCSSNQLTSLVGAPESVGMDFNCGYNQLTSLTGAPKSISGGFSCSYNQLTSLVGAPESVGRSFDCEYNQLTSLVGAPKSVGGDFLCRYNKLTGLEHAPESVGRRFDCRNNQLTGLSGAPKDAEWYMFGDLNTPEKMIAPEYLAGKNTDIPDDILKIMIDNYKKHQAENFRHGTQRIIDNENPTPIVPQNNNITNR